MLQLAPDIGKTLGLDSVCPVHGDKWVGRTMLRREMLSRDADGSHAEDRDAQSGCRLKPCSPCWAEVAGFQEVFSGPSTSLLYFPCC